MSFIHPNRFAFNLVPAEFAAFFSARFSPDALVEFRCIKGDRVHRDWVRARACPDCFPQLQALNEDHFGIFCGVNPRPSQASGENAVRELVAFHADVDGEMRLSGRVPSPSLVVDSGHGRHLYWQLCEPVSVTAENRAMLKSINRNLALAVGGDSACHDLARVLRVPGFTNWKPPKARVRVLESNDFPFTLPDFAGFADAKPSPPASEVHLFSGFKLTDPDRDLIEKFEQLRKSDQTGQITRSWRGQIGDGSSDSRYVLCKHLCEAGFADLEIAVLVCSRRWFNRYSGRVRAPDEVRRDVERILSRLFCVALRAERAPLGRER
jgi:hypothetical protein